MFQSGRRAVLVLLVAIAMISTSGVVPTRGGSPTPAVPRADAAGPYDFTSVTALVDDAVASLPLSGASMIVVKNGTPVYEHYFGTFMPSTAVFIASASKWMSAAAFMTLVDDGVVSLDDPVSMYLPDWTGDRGAITIRQLWSHTAGMGFSHACLGDGTITLAQCVDQIRDTPLLAPPGSQFYYGGMSMQVAGRVAEVASGQSWVDLFNQRIRMRLGLTASTYGPSAANPRIAGGLYSTLQDYAKFLDMLIAGGVYNTQQILQTATVAEMQRDQTANAPIAYSPHQDGRRYGIGEWRDLVEPDGDAVQLSSQGLFGFSPWLDVQRGYYAIFMVQDDFSNVASLVDQLQQQVRAIIGDDGYGCQTNSDSGNLDSETSPPPGATAIGGDATNPHEDATGDACEGDDDNDGLADAVEPAGCNGSVALSPTDFDSDDDLFPDGYECTHGSNPGLAASRPPYPPTGAADTDGDGVLDSTEIMILTYNGAGPANFDGDACSDGRENSGVNADTLVVSSDLAAIAQRFGAYRNTFVNQYTLGPIGAVRYQRQVYDFNRDGTVTSADLAAVAQRFASSPAGPC